MATSGLYALPAPRNEPNLLYSPGSKERQLLHEAYDSLLAELPAKIPLIIDGKEVFEGEVAQQRAPHDHSLVVAEYHQASATHVQQAINSALRAKKAWEDVAWNSRTAIFMRAAELIAGKYRYKLCAATMIGQGKNVWQAEIDAGAEIVDFFRWSAHFTEVMYGQQPPFHAHGTWNRSEYRPLEGFVLAISPFNFTAITGNLAGTPAMLGNVVVLKPSPYAMLSNYVLLQILHEAGLPKDIIQFVPGQPEVVCKELFDHRDFAGLHFTGSTAVFQQLWRDISSRVGKGLRSYPRIVGETGGKNFHLIHPTADINGAVKQSIRAAFEYQGQKCSALSRLYVAKSVWPKFREVLVADLKKITIGSPDQFEHFMGPVISETSFDKITAAISKGKAEGAEVIFGGGSDKTKGWFVEPTVLLVDKPNGYTMINEIFGPVLTVYVYEDDAFEATCDVIDQTSDYSLTGAVFANDRAALDLAAHKLKYSAGNFYINCKTTGAVIGQQSFGGGRGSGTNDKAGSITLLQRFVSTRSIKEQFDSPTEFLYAHNAAD